MDLVDLEQFRVKSAPNTVYYIPNYITNEEEEQLSASIYNAPKPKWTQLSNRRLQNWGGLPSAKGMIQETIPNWLDQYCKRVGSLGIFENKNMPNHVLINEYLVNQGIMPHLDGPFYYPTVSTISLGSHTFLDFYKSLNEAQQTATSDMNATTNGQQQEGGEQSSSLSYSDRYMFSLLVEPRSLLILRDDMYHKYLHGIKETSQDLIDKSCVINYDHLDKTKTYEQNQTLKRTTRISLTIRYVPKVLKLNVSNLLSNKKK